MFGERLSVLAKEINYHLKLFTKNTVREVAMPTSYTGLYVIRADDGIISSVHVVDSDGNTIPLKPQDYLERGAKPPIEHLPDEKDFRAGQSSTHGFPT